MADMKLIAQGWTWVEDCHTTGVYERLYCIRLENPTKRFCVGEPHEKPMVVYVGIYERADGNNGAGAMSPPSAPSSYMTREFETCPANPKSRPLIAA